MGGAASILFWCAAVCRPQAWSARCSGALVWACLSAATPAGAGGWGRWGARCAGPAASPPPASRSLLGEGGRPLGSGEAEGCSRGSQTWGGSRGRVCGGGNPPALVRAPVFPGPASEGAAPFAPIWAPPVRRRPAAGRACGRLPWPWCPLTPGAAASSGGVRGRRLFGLPPSALGPEGEGGGEWGGPSGPLAPPPDGRGGRHGGPGPGGQPSAGGSHPFPTPLYLESDPRAGPRWGNSSPPAVVARGWPAGGGREG